MKKIIKLTILLLIMALISVGCMACDLSSIFGSENKEEENNESNTSEQTEIYTLSGSAITGLTSYGKTLTDFVIPEKINGVTIKSIDEYAFKQSNLKSIVFDSDSKIEKIKHNAFSGCSSLTSITIPSCITSIGSDAFSDCSSLQYNVYDNAKYLGNEKNPYVVLIESVSTDIASCNIYGKCKVIYGGAFYDCRSLTSIRIHDSVTDLGDDSFNGCSSLTSVTIGNGITRIESDVFYNCSSLTSLTIGNGVTDIGYNAFNGCNNLVSITVAENNTEYSSVDGILYNKEQTKFILIPNKISGSVIIPNTMTSIESYAFYGCSCLTSVTIYNSVKSIERYAFYKCNSLTKVNYMGTLDQWVQINFSLEENGSCYSNPLMSAKNLYINNVLVTEANIITASKINAYAFSGCSSLIRVTIDNDVKSIDDEAFGNCSSLTSVVIGSGVTNIGRDAFYGCSSLTSIIIPDNVTSLGWFAFSDCNKLSSVTIGNGVTSIGDFAFSGCSSLASVTIGNGVTDIRDGVFNGCNNLVSITVVENNTKYSSVDGILYNKEQTKFILIPNKISGSVTIPNTMTSIKDCAFYYCDSLTSITIGNGVTSIGYKAFSCCGSLTSVTIGNSVTSIERNAFELSGSLTKVTFKNPNGWYVSKSSSATSGINLTLTNTSQNAKYLWSTYRDYYWERK